MTQISKVYDPKIVESKWYNAWLEGKAFAGRRTEDKDDAYCIMIPPPNVTGMLHMGHILDNTLQDIFIRRARLEGKGALWYPGTDHAGIATQTRVEQNLRAEGKTKYDLGREAFLEKVWEFRTEKGGIILDQLQKLGASCDWDRTAFTLDPHYARSVLSAFVKLYERGYIYRGKRMVNWCPASLTALSDEEVEVRPQKGILYKMRYEIVERPGQYLEISTTRPETLMGDTGVAVHPEDDRYRDLVGLHCWRPFPKAKIPIIADDYIDREFGTGVLKVTPAHDKADFEIGQRHGLAAIDVFNRDGTLNAHSGEEFDGMERFAARKKAAKKLRDMGLMVEEEPYENRVGFSQRANVPVEPRLSEQWFMRYPKVEEAKEAVSKGYIKFHPKRWENVYLHWLNNITDWCISRQLWWGHRIPVWYKKGADRNDEANRHVSVDGPPDPENWEQDEDVLDTWASSNLWPLANFGWPEPDENQQKDLDYFYPTKVLVTGFDIIFFWVARMIMAGLEMHGPEKKTLTDEEIQERIPFENVYIHGLIRDIQGRKMSKTLGNSPDPLDLIEKFGADGLRFGIVNIAPTGQDILFGEDRVQIGRNFCNKLWNAARFRQVSGPLCDNSSLEAIIGRLERDQFDEYDHWILTRLLAATQQVNKLFDTYLIERLTGVLYEFFWGDFCDWYVEISKSKLKDDRLRDNCLAIQDLVLRQFLLLLEPICPHITEELWNDLGYASGDTFMQDTENPCLQSQAELREWIEQGDFKIDAKAASRILDLQTFVMKARSLKAEYGVANSRDAAFYFTAPESSQKFLESHATIFNTLVGAGQLAAVETRPEGAPAAVTSLGTLYLDLTSALDIGAEKDRLERELAKLEKAVAAGESKLGNQKFLNNAPANIVEGARRQLADSKEKKEKIARLLAELG